MSAGTSMMSRSGVAVIAVLYSFDRRSRPARNDEIGGLPQQVGRLPERLQMRRGLLGQKLGLVARPLLAEDRHESSLARRDVLAWCLAELLGRAVDVEQIVDHLEGKTEIVGIGREGHAQRLGRLAQRGPRGT